MKRLFAWIMCMAILLSAWVVVTPAEEPLGTAEVNYVQGIEWNKKVGSPTVTVTEGGAVMTGVANSWDSAGCDILPAVKAALGEEDMITVKLTVEARAALKAGNEGDTVYVRPLLRGTNTLAGAGDAEWGAAYAASLDGDYPVFAMTGGNIMKTFSEGGMNLPDGEWVTFETVLELTRNQISSSLLSEWVFCVDSIGGIDMIDNIEFKNLSITETESVSGGQLGIDPTDDTTPLPRELTAEVWSPVEILLRSTVDYKNPYVETEIDAVFTHTDGTTVTLPGFWMAGKTWAVRFSPTKEGDWSYSVTCKDASNTGLFATGTIHATAATKNTATAEHGFITTVKDQHYYRHTDGTPFFWLGDTNWQAFTNLSTTICNYPGCDCGSQFKHIVDDRVEKGFTVYQTYFVPEAGNGEKPLWLDDRHQQPDTAVFNDKIDGMFEYLHEQGLVIALGLGCHGSTMSRMQLEDFLRFTRYVVARYACYSLVWITGQEITELGASATPGYSAFDCYMEAAALVEELDGYKHPNSAHMFPAYATDESPKRLDQAPWHDSWTVQGGHGFIQPKAYYESYYKAQGSGFLKPFIESEANYEDINCGPFTGYDANRKSAWKAILCGSAGFTYGVTGIWASSFSTSGFTGWYGGTTSYSYDPWYMALGKPGSFEMSYMKDFFTAIGPWYELVPRFKGDRSATFLTKEDCVLASTEDASLFVAYFYGERTKTGRIEILDKDQTYDAYWFDPRTGRFIPVEKDVVSDSGQYSIPDKPDSRDWVFLLTSRGLPEHYEGTMPTDLNPAYEQVAPTGSQVTPVAVEAIGGITYSGTKKDAQTMTDNTLWLWDGDPNTVWTPSANRTTQTFLFDLGTAHDLTHIVIAPAEGTIIPKFRVEGSNDGKLWTIITDTSVRDVENPGAGSEPLTSVYRYVKVLLLNADSLNIGADKLDTLPYEAMYNPMTSQSYSVTKITDVAIYSNGEGTPALDQPVVSPVGGPSDSENTDVSDTESTDVIDTDPTIGIDTEENTNQTKTPAKGGCASAIGAGAIVLALIGAAALLMRRRGE